MPRRVLARLTYANVVATLALFLSLGGAAYAGAKIGSADIKNHSIGAIDIKDDSLTAGQLAQGSVGSSEVIDHSLRLIDLNGTVKDAFKKTVFQTHVGPGAAITIPASPSSVDVASLSVPAGGYLLSATVHVQGPLTDNGNGGSPPVEVECTMGETGATSANTTVAVEDFRGEYHDDHVLPLTLATRVSSNPIVVRCDRTQAPVVTDSLTLEVSLEALRVDTIS